MSLPVIVGGGLAGLSLALALAPRPVLVIGHQHASSMTSSELAQGGIAAAIGLDDSLRLHEQDTLSAGAGLCDPRVVKTIVEHGPRAIERLAMWGVVFDRDKTGNCVLGLEGAHSRRRIVHANGDSTGASVMKALVARAQSTPSIMFIDDAIVSEITTGDRGVNGVTFFRSKDRVRQRVVSDCVVVATGSACALWRHTTVPHGSWGHGLLLAAQAGARLRDLEFVQFHPTALDAGLDPMPLISEALRGEGALLVNSKGESFVGELNPRDVVARAIWAQAEKGYKVYLDARKIERFRERFPTILESCLKAGVDPREHMIPIRPVSHYHMGGIGTDISGKTNVDGLRACGECACTGLHGANRLASNSLLEAIVMGCRIADELRPRVSMNAQPEIHDLQTVDDRVETPEDIARVRAVMTAKVGLVRNQADLVSAIETLESLALTSLRAQIGVMIAKAALLRQESRGAHDRKDFPRSEPELAQSRYVSLNKQKIVVE